MGREHGDNGFAILAIETVDLQGSDPVLRAFVNLQSDGDVARFALVIVPWALTVTLQSGKPLSRYRASTASSSRRAKPVTVPAVAQDQEPRRLNVHALADLICREVVVACDLDRDDLVAFAGSDVVGDVALVGTASLVVKSTCTSK